ncbi:hypothetical protein P691DRAFT_685775 [Macrolepiota fuliginosa MF-IS2]|uniref:Uncharacterized protein n=1 Tax=Macrolepiota fuliginosa MF-IS2 TaxID=1400762 RepID=A0A9P5WZZ0_9AGAR|nr:hypothetical protein P691DRAFT_685775 [Macrolepiota fuliginosa MF-IS2]
MSHVGLSAQKLLLAEGSDLISTTTVNGLLYGIGLSLYVLTARSLYPQSKDSHNRRQTTFMLVYTPVVIVCGIIVFALATREAQLAYINNNNFLGEPIEYEAAYLTVPRGRAQDLLNIAVDALTLGIQIWRLWVIYHPTRYAIIVVILPLLLLLCFTGKSLNHPSSDANLTCYMSIATMLIESYTLESAWTLGLLISYVLNNFAAVALFSECDAAIEIIAFLLLLYQVSTGRAWNKQTEQQITRSLHFNHDTGRTTQTTVPEIATQVSQVDTNVVHNLLPPTPLAV